MTEERLKELNALDNRRRRMRKELDAWLLMDENNLWSALQDNVVQVTDDAFGALRARRLAQLQVEIERVESEWARA